MRDLRAIIRKEILELVRDYRTLLTLSLFPLATMPLIALLITSLQVIQVPSVLIINQDNSSGVLGDANFTSPEIISLIREGLVNNGVRVFTEKNTSSIDLIVIIPDGFTRNLTLLDSQAVIQVYQVPGSSASDRAYSALASVVSDLSRRISDLKIKYLGELASVNITNPNAVRDPVVIGVSGYIAPSGQSISYEEAFKIFVSRILVFSLIFVSTPATTYIVDSILGEKERKTLEILLSTPISRRYLIIGKVFASSLVGLFAALIDMLAIILFFVILSSSYGARIMIDTNLLVLTGVVVYLTTLATLAIALPLIIRSSTMRTAQIISSIVTIASSMIFLSVLFVDFYSLPRETKYLLSIVPYTDSVLVIQYFAFGETMYSVIHLAIMILIILSLILLSLKLLNEEKLLLKPL